MGLYFDDVCSEAISKRRLIISQNFPCRHRRHRCCLRYCGCLDVAVDAVAAAGPGVVVGAAADAVVLPWWLVVLVLPSSWFGVVVILPVVVIIIVTSVVGPFASTELQQ